MNFNGEPLLSESEKDERSSSCSAEENSNNHENDSGETSNENDSAGSEEISSEAPVAGPSGTSGYVDLSTDPRLVVNHIVNKFEIEESHLLPPLGAGDVEGGNPRVSKPRKPREKRTPKEPGATLVTEKKLFNLRLDHFISDEVEFRVPTTEERADSPPEGYFTCIYDHVKLSFLWFPIPEVIVRLFWRHNICFSQVAPQSFRHIIALMVRSYEQRHELTLAEMRYFLQVAKGQKLHNHYFAPRAGCKLITDTPTKDGFWERSYFYVKINAASIEGDLSLVKTEWDWRVSPKRPKKPEGIEALYHLLKRHSCRWPSFSFERVDLARAIAIGAAEFVPDDPLLSPEELEAKMAELIIVRKRRLDVLRDERVDEIKKSTPSLLENPERAKAKGGARAATALGKASKEASSKDASSKASPPKTAGSKRLSSEVKGKGVAGSEKKRLKSLDSTKDCVEISQFGALLREGTLIPDYSSFAQSNRIENAWGHLAEVCMETNHAFISYEADLKAQRGEIADLKRKLKETATLAETEKNTAEKTQKKLDKLRSKLNEKGVENNKLKEELVTARQSREVVEKEIKEKLFDKVHERCELVKSLLTQFRYGPVLQANFYGQTKNNLHLVRSLLSKNPPDLEEEKAELKKDMKEYWKAPKEYERAFNRLIRILSFEGGEFGEDEAEQVDEEEEEYKDDSETDEGEEARDRNENEELQGNEHEETEVVEQEKDQEMGDGEKDQEDEGQVVKDSEDQVEDENAFGKDPDMEKPADTDMVGS